MGQLVAELRKVYITAKAEATPILEDILGEGSLQSIEKETTEIEAVGKSLQSYCSSLIAICSHSRGSVLRWQEMNLQWNCSIMVIAISMYSVQIKQNNLHNVRHLEKVYLACTCSDGQALILQTDLKRRRKRLSDVCVAFSEMRVWWFSVKSAL